MKNVFVHVAAAAILNDKGEVLVSQRKQDTHLGGYWEFPGGKLEPGETVERALARELAEELDIALLSGRPLIRTRHRYAEKSVLLDVWRVDSYRGQPRGVEGQNIAWRRIRQLDPSQFPPADVPIINALWLPSRYLITGLFSSVGDFSQRLARALDDGIELVQLRLTPELLADMTQAEVETIVGQCTELSQRYSARLLMNLPERYKRLITQGIHLNSRSLLRAQHRPAYPLVSASCHNRHELEHAQSIGADFAVLSPVRRTRSHPDAKPLGWEEFQQLVDACDIPVYALGGMTLDDLPTAWQSGAQGIAAIGAFWGV